MKRSNFEPIVNKRDFLVSDQRCKDAKFWRIQLVYSLGQNKCTLLYYTKLPRN